MNFPQRWWLSLPFLIALAVLLFLGWSVSQAVMYPYDGITMLTPAGVVKQIDLNGPTASRIRDGDIIQVVNGVPMREAWPFYRNRRAGDIVSLEIQRGNDRLPVVFRLADPSFEESASRLAPLLIALIFWILGVTIQAFKPAREATVLFFLFFQTSAVLLIVGASSLVGPPWFPALLIFIIWVIGPLMVHFHFYFPQVTSIKRWHGFLKGLYGVGFLGGISYIIITLQPSKINGITSFLQDASRYFLALNFLLVVGLLFYVYRHATTSGVRSKIRIVVLGGALSLLPMVSLIILPDALAGETIIPYAFLFLFLGVLPLTYGYAIFRHRLVEIERHVNRGATFILVYSILGAFYLVLSSLLQHLVPALYISHPTSNILIVLILASIFVPLHRTIQHVVDSVFYGGWYDYRSAVTQITQGLEQVTELNPLAQAIVSRLSSILRLEETCVFLRDLDGDFTVIEVAPNSMSNGFHRISYSPLPRSSLSYLLKVGGVIERTVLRKELAEVSLTPEEHKLLNSEQVHLWVPIIGHGQVLGLFAMGPKYGGDIFSSEDMDILRVVARHISPLIENIHLLTRLKRHAADLEQRVADRTEELHAAKEHVEAILSSVGEGVIVTDLRGRIVRVNTAFEEQTGYKAQELVGQRVWLYYEMDDVIGTLRDIQTTLRHDRVWNGELTGCCKDGSQYDVLLAITSLRNPHGQLVGYVGSQRDVTRQKELDRLKNRFIFDVSHELRTPVANINLYLELLERGKVEKRADYMAVMKSEVGHLIHMIENILDISRLDVSKLRKVEFTSVDLNMLTEQVVSTYRPLADTSGIELSFTPQGNLPEIQGEQNQLARMISNLLSNAVRYTARGYVRVSTFWEGEKVCLQIQDSGMGIHSEDIPHLFERFYRGRQVSQSSDAGAGLGLAVVKEIVDLHDGEIEIQSELGVGSLFRVVLPIQNSNILTHSDSKEHYG